MSFSTDILFNSHKGMAIRSLILSNLEYQNWFKTDECVLLVTFHSVLSTTESKNEIHAFLRGKHSNHDFITKLWHHLGLHIRSIHFMGIQFFTLPFSQWLTSKHLNGKDQREVEKWQFSALFSKEEKETDFGLRVQTVCTLGKQSRNKATGSGEEYVGRGLRGNSNWRGC